MATQDLSAEQAKGNTRTNPFTGLHDTGEAESNSPMDEATATTAPKPGSLPQVAEILEAAYQSALREIEVLEFLSQTIGDTGDPLELSADGRAGLSMTLATTSAVLGRISGRIDEAKGMLPDSEPAQ